MDKTFLSKVCPHCPGGGHDADSEEKGDKKKKCLLKFEKYTKSFNLEGVLKKFKVGYWGKECPSCSLFPMHLCVFKLTFLSQGFHLVLTYF